jgi:hypothetical protein
MRTYKMKVTDSFAPRRETGVFSCAGGYKGSNHHTSWLSSVI